jgi:membrane protein implicated in regulation of membrane protease activity
MANAPHSLAQRAVFFAVLALSALTMIALLWHYPVKTLIATALLLALFAVAVRLARAIETDPDLIEHEQRTS